MDGWMDGWMSEGRAEAGADLTEQKGNGLAPVVRPEGDVAIGLHLPRAMSLARTVDAKREHPVTVTLTLAQTYARIRAPGTCEFLRSAALAPW